MMRRLLCGAGLRKGDRLMSDSSNGFDRLEADVLAGRLDRRQVLKRGAMLGLSAPVIAGLLAACGGSSEKAT